MPGTKNDSKLSRPYKSTEVISYLIVIMGLVMFGHSQSNKIGDSIVPPNSIDMMNNLTNPELTNIFLINQTMFGHVFPINFYILVATAYSKALIIWVTRSSIGFITAFYGAVFNSRTTPLHFVGASQTFFHGVSVAH